MYRDAQEELKRLEEALLEEDRQQENFGQWDEDEDFEPIVDSPKERKRKKDNRNKAIFGLTVAVIILTAAMVGILLYLLAGYGRWFS